MRNQLHKKVWLLSLSVAAVIVVGVVCMAGSVGGRWVEMKLPDLGEIWDLNAVAFADPSIGWAVGAIEDTSCAVVLKYRAGEWKRVYTPCGGKLRVIHLVDIALSGPRDGWAVGDVYWVWSDPDRFRAFSARLHGGKWKAVPVPRVGRSFKFEGVAIPPGGKVAWAVGGTAQRKRRSGFIMRHTDRWRVVNVPAPPKSQWELKDIDCPSPGRCWAVGRLIEPLEGANPLLVMAYRGGAWQREQTPSPPAAVINPELSCVSFPTPGRGWAAGMGVILSYRDGKWERDVPQRNVQTWKITSISFPKPDYGHAVGWDIEAKKPLWLQRTPAGWRRCKTPFDAELTGLNGVFLLKRTLGWAVGGIQDGSSYPAGLFRYQSQ